MGCHALLQGIFPNQGSNLRLLLGGQILHHGATWEALDGILHNHYTSLMLHGWSGSPKGFDDCEVGLAVFIWGWGDSHA